MLLHEESNYNQTSSNEFDDLDLMKLCQMLRLKPMPDSLRIHVFSSTGTTSNASSVKRIRLTTPGSAERTSNEEFFDQLLTPFIVSSNVCNVNSGTGEQQPFPVHPLPTGTAMSELNLPPPTTQVKSYLISHNQMYFQYIGGSNVLLNLINNFTMLKPYVLHLLAIEEGAPLRLVKLDSNVFELICDRMESDVGLVNQMFALNRLLEPLSCDRISKMIVIVQACLYAALTLISHSCQENICSSDKENFTSLEKSILSISDKCLELYKNLFEIFRQSNRVAGQICQNAHMFTSWMLFTGLQIILNTKSSSNASNSTNNNKRQQGYNFLCISLAKHALKLMSYLLDDLHLEFGDQSDQMLDDVDDASRETSLNSLQELNFLKKFSFSNQPQQDNLLSPSSSQSSISSTCGLSTPSNNIRSNSSTGPISAPIFKYNKFGHYSAWQRIEMIVSSNLNIIQLLFGYLSAGYRRAGLLRHSNWNLPLEPNEVEVGETEEKYFDDLEKDHTEEMFESFGEINEPKPTSNAGKTAIEQDIDSHYELVISILDHLNYYYVCSKMDALQCHFKQMITDAQLIVLAHIIQDLDFELENVQMLSPLSSKTFYKFSSSLTSLMHNLIAMQILSESQQNSLLAYLGFKPITETESSWGLYHGARSLSILAQIILLRQQKEKEDIKLDLNSVTIQMWRGFINQLKQASLKFKGDLAFFNDECPAYYEDLNVEHAQLMLFLFHNLKLLQRKHVFSLVGTTLYDISVEFNSSSKRAISAAQVLFIGRLLHLFEYMCKNLYDTPPYLFEQINHNLLILMINREFQSGFSKDDLIKGELEEWLLSGEKYSESFRNIIFFVDKKLELNYFNSIIASKGGNNLPSSNSSSFSSVKSNQNNASMSFFDFILHPRFYHLMDISYFGSKTSSRQFVPKLDGKSYYFFYLNLFKIFIFYNRNCLQFYACRFRRVKLRSILSIFIELVSIYWLPI